MSGDSFTPAHHALLFGWLAREVVQRTGVERGEAAIRRGVRRYGEERGRRMALRAQADGYPLDFVSYLAYGEWRAAPGEMGVEVLAGSPDLHQQVTRCSWATAWATHDLMPYGRLYCLEIDEAVARGFNPALRLAVRGTRPSGDPCCDFVFHGAGLDEEGSRRLTALRAALGMRATMPWEYHAAHLYHTIGGVVVAELGDEGGEMVEAALAEFAAAFDPQAAEVVRSYAGTDFSRLPESD